MALGHPSTALLQYLFHLGCFILQLCMDEILSLLQGQGILLRHLTWECGLWAVVIQVP